MNLHLKQKQIVRSNARFKIVKAGRRGGKDLDSNTPIITPSGFKLLKHLKVGDFVYNEKGKKTKIVKVEDYSNRKCYEVIFNDGKSLIASSTHLWEIHDKRYRKNYKRNSKTKAIVVDTEYIKNNLLVKRKDNKIEHNIAIPITNAVEFDKKQIKLEPYFLGLWLGDGTTLEPAITTADKEIEDYLFDFSKRNNYNIKQKGKQKSKAKTFYISGGLKALLPIGNKHIPEDYLYSSVEDRIELLKGLMDSDGCLSCGKYEFTTTKKQIADDFDILINSLGIKSNIKVSNAKLYGRIVSKRYRFIFTTDLIVATLTRKIRTTKIKGDSKYRFVIEVKEVDSRPTRCIAVDSPSHLFLAGKYFIPTHNTTLEIEDMIFEATSGNDRPIFYIAPTQKQARDIIWESLKTRLAGIGQANESRLEMKVPTVDGGYSIIYVSGWENRENFRGKKAWKQYFDELDTMKDFFVGWQEIFRPALTDYAGHAMFSGTPNNKNPNLKRLEKLAEKDTDYAVFTFKSADNPHLPPEEIEKARLELDPQSFRQEYEAEYATEVGSLFAYSNVLDVFTNTIDKTSDKYLIVDVAGEGTDKTKFSRWEGLEEVSRETFSHLTQEEIIHKIRDYCALYQIPMSHVAVDSIGIGEGIASNSMLRGIVGFKSSYSAIKTEKTIVQLQNVHYIKEPPLISDYTNLRSQCIFKLANLVYNHKIASKVTGDAMENILEELPLYQDISLDSNKRQATGKEDIKGLLGRSPDDSDTWIMRMYFEIVDSVNPITEEHKEASNKQLEQFRKNFNNIRNYSTK